MLSIHATTVDECTQAARAAGFNVTDHVNGFIISNGAFVVFLDTQETMPRFYGFAGEWSDHDTAPHSDFPNIHAALCYADLF